jgi:hypothetical protein
MDRFSRGTMDFLEGGTKTNLTLGLHENKQQRLVKNNSSLVLQNVPL